MVVQIGLAPIVMCLNAWAKGSGTTTRCGLVGVGADLLEEGHHSVGGFEVSYVFKSG